MEFGGGGWTVCYNHNIQNPEEMHHSSRGRMGGNYGKAGETEEYGTCHFSMPDAGMELKENTRPLVPP